jgi:hypothetical protein
MKKSFAKYFLIVVLAFLAVSCKKKEEEEKLTISVSPVETFLTAIPGSTKTFSISGSSPVRLERLKIYYKLENGNPVFLQDSLLSTKTFSQVYYFQVPNFGTQNVYLQMFFELADSEGNVVNAAKGIDVNFTNRSLAETVDNEMFSRLSGNPSAYNLRAGVSLNYIIPATESMNITDSLQADSLSYSWISPAGGLFVRSNSFDYQNASLESVKNAFEAGGKTNKISELVVGDIILFKQTYSSEVFYAAIKITSIQNNAGSNTDKYIFNIKK